MGFTISSVGVSPSPATIQPHGGVATFTPVLVDPSTSFSVVLFDDQGGQVGSGQVTINAENVTFTTDASQKGQPGFLYAELSPGAAATLAVGSDGLSFVATAA